MTEVKDLERLNPKYGSKAGENAKPLLFCKKHMPFAGKFYKDHKDEEKKIADIAGIGKQIFQMVTEPNVEDRKRKRDKLRAGLGSDQEVLKEVAFGLAKAATYRAFLQMDVKMAFQDKVHYSMPSKMALAALELHRTMEMKLGEHCEHKDDEDKRVTKKRNRENNLNAKVAKDARVAAQAAAEAEEQNAVEEDAKKAEDLDKKHDDSCHEETALLQ